MKIQKSVNYDRFESPVAQRPINQNKVATIAESMKKFGFFEPEHITVREKGSKYQIVKGQHRFFAAQLSKSPVYFVVDNDITDQQMIALEEFRPTWSITDFVNAQAHRGNENYDVLLAFVEKYKMPMGTAANLLDGSMGERNARNGSFVPTHEKQAVNVMEIASAMPFDGAKDSRFLYALVRVMKLPSFDPKRLLSGKTALTLLRRQRTVEQYIQMIEEVYNYSRSTKVNIAWQCAEMKAKAKMTALQNGRDSHKSKNK